MDGNYMGARTFLPILAVMGWIISIGGGALAAVALVKAGLSPFVGTLSLVVAGLTMTAAAMIGSAVIHTADASARSAERLEAILHHLSQPTAAGSNGTISPAPAGHGQTASKFAYAGQVISNDGESYYALGKRFANLRHAQDAVDNRPIGTPDQVWTVKTVFGTPIDTDGTTFFAAGQAFDTREAAERSLEHRGS